jgi:hypothetical protein
VLHEEALRGIHILSVCALQPGANVLVELEQTVPLSNAGGVPFLRLPMTAGHVYGISPLLPSDDLLTAEAMRHEAALSVTVDIGLAILDGQTLTPDVPRTVVLDRAIELQIEGGAFGSLSGVAADGRTVELSLQPARDSHSPLDLHILIDRSGSTASPVSDGQMSIWQAMRNGLESELSTLDEDDRVTLWQFDNQCQWLGEAQGPSCGTLVNRLEPPVGGTELSAAIKKTIARGARDILVLTDGQTWAHLVEELKGEGPRVSAILAGPGSLDANIGHLCALTGGQVFYAPGQDVSAALRSAFAALRQTCTSVEGSVDDTRPSHVRTVRGGIAMKASSGLR